MREFFLLFLEVQYKHIDKELPIRFLSFFFQQLYTWSLHYDLKRTSTPSTKNVEHVLQFLRFLSLISVILIISFYCYNKYIANSRSPTSLINMMASNNTVLHKGLHWHFEMVGGAMQRGNVHMCMSINKRLSSNKRLPWLNAYFRLPSKK